MHADADGPAKAFDDVVFDEFYEQALPVVYGYLLRLCGGTSELVLHASLDRGTTWERVEVGDPGWGTTLDSIANALADARRPLD